MIHSEFFGIFFHCLTGCASLARHSIELGTALRCTNCTLVFIALNIFPLNSATLTVLCNTTQLFHFPLIFVTTFHWIAWQWHNNSVSKHSVTKTMFYHFTIVCRLHLVKECLFVSAYQCLHLGCHVFRHCLRCHLNLKLTWETDSGISTSYIYRVIDSTTYVFKGHRL